MPECSSISHTWKWSNPRQVECGGTEDENRGNSQAQAKRHSFNPYQETFLFYLRKLKVYMIEQSKKAAHDPHHLSLQ